MPLSSADIDALRATALAVAEMYLGGGVRVDIHPRLLDSLQIRITAPQGMWGELSLSERLLATDLHEAMSQVRGLASRVCLDICRRLETPYHRSQLENLRIRPVTSSYARSYEAREISPGLWAPLPSSLVKNGLPPGPKPKPKSWYEHIQEDNIL